MKHLELFTKSCRTKSRNAILRLVSTDFQGVEVNRSEHLYIGFPCVCGGVKLHELKSHFKVKRLDRPKAVSICLKVLLTDHQGSHKITSDELLRASVGRRKMEQDDFTSDRVDLKEAFYEVVANPVYAKQRDFLECFWITFQDYVRWKELELLELSSNHIFDEAA